METSSFEFRDQVRARAREGTPDLLLANPLATMLTGSLRRRVKPKRARGRPQKKTLEFFADVLMGHEGVVAWHQATYGDPARSDAALYRAFRWHVAQTVEADGVVALAAREAATWPRLKTVLNTLAEARAFFRKHPEKWPFTGTDKTARQASNHCVEEENLNESAHHESVATEACARPTGDGRGTSSGLQYVCGEAGSSGDALVARD